MIWFITIILVIIYVIALFIAFKSAEEEPNDKQN